MAWDPDEDLMPRKPKMASPKYFPAREIEKILAVGKQVDRQVAAVCAVAAFAGLRREEIFLLDWRQVNLGDRRIEIPESKTDKPRWTPVFDELVGQLFPAKKRGKVFTRWVSVDRMAQEIKEVIAKATGRRERWCALHHLRHSASTHLQAQGVAASVVGDWLGHRVSTAEKYYRGKLPMGEKPLIMTFRGHPLEKHGIPNISARKAASR